MRTKTLRILFSTALLGSVTACTTYIDARGNQPDPERLAEVQAGKTNRDDVTALLGTPSNTAMFDDETWYYISSKFKRTAFFDPVEIEREVVVISFDKRGMVKDVRQLSMKDGKEVTPVARETPTAGRDLSVMEQLLGNVGRFNKSKDTTGK